MSEYDILCHIYFWSLCIKVNDGYDLCILFSQEQKQSLATQLNWLCHSLLQALVEMGNYLLWVVIVLLSLYTFKQKGNSLTDIFSLAYCRVF